MDQDRMNRQGQAAGVMSRPRLAATAALLVLSCGLAAFLVLGNSANTQALSASGAVGSARNKPITGALSQSGYTVIALARNGRAKTVRAGSGEFRLRPPAKKVTLHLRASDGTYAGPIVVAGTWNLVKVAKQKLRRAERKLKKAKARLSKASGKKAIRKARRKVSAARKKVKQARSGLKAARRRAGGKEAVLGVTHGAALGAISVKAAAGYAKAKLNLRQWKRWAVEENRARAKKGVPIGAGNFGRVRSSQLTGSAVGDLDRDGVSDPLDIDDDGDLVLDNLDRSPRGGRTARASQSDTGDFLISPWLETFFPEEAVNANAPGFEGEKIEAFLANRGRGLGVTIQNLSSPDPNASSELDCGGAQDSEEPGLTYCTTGGTGWAQGPDDVIPFPGEPGGYWDPDGDGFGSFPEDNSLGFAPRATRDEIKTGDVLIQRIEHTDGSVEEAIGTLPYLFWTTPALASYDDGQGNSQELSYPTPGDEFPVKADPTSGDVVVELEFWRPQRQAISPETGDWYDLGGLSYAVGAGRGGSGAVPEICDLGTYSTDDSNLVPIEIPPDRAGSGGGFRDLATDQPASPANTLTFQLNLTECAQEAGSSFDPGKIQRFVLFTTSSVPPEGSQVADLVVVVFGFQRTP